MISTARQEMYRFIGNVLFYRTISPGGKQPDSSNLLRPAERPEEKGEPGTRQDFGIKIAEINV